MDNIELGSIQFWQALDTDPNGLAAQVCGIDLVDLDGTLQRHPALRAWLNAAHETAKMAEERAEWELTCERARALLEAKSTLDPHTGKSKTVDVLKAETEVNEKVGAAQASVWAAQKKRGALRAMTSALEDRVHMLVQLSANQRAERGDYK